MANKEYHFYTTRDFALDESFQNWMLRPDVKNKYFWETWLLEHPEKEEAIKKAKELVSSVQFRSYKLTNDEREHLWDSVWDKMVHEETEIAPELTIPKRSHHWMWKYAAVFIGLIALFSIWKKFNNQPSKTISFSAYTHFGEMKKLILPDSSEVTLNANSKIVYNDKNDKEREVWLDGEVFFHVKHTFDNKKFIVHTYDKLSIEVLGTQFNVNSRGEQIAVVLQKGSIKLDIGEDNGNGETQLYLKPGEMINYNKQDGDYTKTEVDAVHYDSWAKGRLTMNNYSLEDAAGFIQQIFDTKIIVTDQSLLGNKISGSMPIVYNIDTMLVQFGKAFSVHFHQQGNAILVKR